MDNVKKFFQAPVFEDKEKTRAAELVSLILNSLMVIAVIGLVALFAGGSRQPVQVIVTLVFVLFMPILRIPLRRGYVMPISVSIVVIATLVLYSGLVTTGTVRVPSLSLLILINVIAGLTIGRWAAYLNAGLNSLFIIGMVYGEINGLLPPANNVSNPQNALTFILASILTVILLNQALGRIQFGLELAEQNETKLIKLNQELEQRITERTSAMEQTNLYLALATEIGQNVSQVRDLNVMLRDAAEIIRAFFGMYYVQVYLTNPAQTELVLQFGTGDVGVELLSRHHRLPLDDGSINGRAAVTKRSVVIADTSASPTFRPNLLLPNTRSEMAVPLLVGEQLVGVLDMQSEQPGALSESALIAFEPLSGQLAVAIQNARLVAESERARNELEALTRRLTRSGWDEYLDAIHRPEVSGFLYEGEQVTPLTDVEAQPSGDGATISADIAIGGELLGSLVMETDKPGRSTRAAELLNSVARQVAQQIENLRLLDSADRYRFDAEQAMRRLTRQGWDTAQAQSSEMGYLYRNYQIQPITELVEAPNTHTFPITVRNEFIGEIAVAGIDELSEEEGELLTSVCQQLAAHLENLRLSQETQNALIQTEALYAASAQVVRATSIAEVLRAVVENTPLNQFERASIMLFNRPWVDSLPETGMLMANWERTGWQPVISVGTVFPLASMPTTRHARRDRPTFWHVTPDDMPSLSAEEYAMFQRIGVNTVILPMVVSEQWIGWLSAASNDNVNLSEDDLRQIATLTGQAATVIQSIRLLDEATARARREQSLRQIATRVRTFVEPEMILRTAARELGDALGRKVTIQLGSGQTQEPKPESEPVA